MSALDREKYADTLGSRSFGPEVQERWLECIRNGMRFTNASKSCNINRTTVWEYRKQHPEFEARIREAEAEACELVEDQLMLKITEDRHFPAMVFWLLNRSGGRWKDLRASIFNELKADPDNDMLRNILTRLDDQK